MNKCLNCEKVLHNLEYTQRCSGCGWINAIGTIPYDFSPYKPLQKTKQTEGGIQYCFPPIETEHMKLLKEKMPRTFEAFSKFLEDKDLTYAEHKNLYELKKNKYLHAKCYALRYIMEHDEDSRRKVTVSVLSHMKALRREGLTKTEIAERLDLSRPTVDKYLDSEKNS